MADARVRVRAPARALLVRRFARFETQLTFDPVVLTPRADVLMTETTPTRPRAQGEGFSSGASPEDDQKRARTGQSDGEEVEADEEIESLMALSLIHI